MTKASAAELLDLVADKAKKLRDAGVLAVELEGLSFSLAPAEPDADLTDNEDEDDGPVDALHDPATFGRKKKVPGRQRREEPQS